MDRFKDPVLKVLFAFLLLTLFIFYCSFCTMIEAHQPEATTIYTPTASKQRTLTSSKRSLAPTLACYGHSEYVHFTVAHTKPTHFHDH